MRDRPTIALIGCGAIARNAHFASLNEGPFELVALVDQDVGRAATMAADTVSHPECFSSHREMLESCRPDAVIVATPPAAHCEPSIDALQAGAHVLCEKPAALDVQEVVRMRDAALDAGRTLQFYSSRFRKNWVYEARRKLERGELGTIYRAEIQLWLPYARACDAGRPVWFGQRHLAGGGVFLDMGQYFLDALFYLLGWPAVKTVTAEAFSEIPTGLAPETLWDTEDHLSLLARLENGISLNLETAARLHQNWRWGIRILGTRGALEFDQTQPKENSVMVTTVDAPEHLEQVSLLEPENQVVPDTLRRLETLARHLAGEPASIVAAGGTTPDEALTLSRFCEAAYRSAETHTGIHLET